MNAILRSIEESCRIYNSYPEEFKDVTLEPVISTKKSKKRKKKWSSRELCKPRSPRMIPAEGQSL